jgi:hypothetical protein
MNGFTYCNIREQKWECGAKCGWYFDLANNEIQVPDPSGALRRLATLDPSGKVTLDPNFVDEFQILPLIAREIRKYVKPRVISLRKRKAEYADHLDTLMDQLRAIEGG